MELNTATKEELLSVVDVIERFAIHSNTLRLWRIRGSKKKNLPPLPAIKKAGRYFYLESDIIHFKDKK